MSRLPGNSGDGMPRLNILYLHQYFTTLDMVGGTRSYELARRLVDAGHHVCMVTTDRESAGSTHTGKWRTSFESGIEVHWTPVPYDNRMSYIERMKAFLQFSTRAAVHMCAQKADVIYATSTPLTVALPAAVAAKYLKVPMVFEVRDLWPAVPIAMGVLRAPLLRSTALWLERFAYRNSTHVVALAPGMKQHIVSSGYPEERVTVIPNGADLALFVAERGRGARIRAELPWLGERPMVIYCGAIGKLNRVDQLVHIAAATAKRDVEVRFVVVGTGREEPRVRELAAELGVLNRNFFMQGAVPKREVPAWLDAADVAIALITGPEILWKHATQNKFFDALAAGRAILSNFRGWQSILAEEAGAGLIFDTEDAEAAAQRLVSVVRDPQWLARAGTAARALAAREFDRDAHAKILENVLVGAVNEYRGNDRFVAGRHETLR